MVPSTMINLDKSIPTGETLDRIFLSLKSQFTNFEYEKKEFAFVRTEQQINKIIKEQNYFFYYAYILL